MAPNSSCISSWGPSRRYPHNFRMPVLDPTLPEYQVDEAQALPVYSAQAGSSECLLQFEPPRRTGCPACEWIFETKHFKVNLGRKMWKLNSPTYGLHGHVDGSLELLDPACNVESIQATVEGRLRLTCPEKKVTADNCTFLSHTVNVPYDPGVPECTFSVPVPSSTMYEGNKFACPPSFFFADTGYILEVSYYIRFSVTWRIKKRRKTESRLISFYYLPKTNPISPPICILPPASRHCENPPLFLVGPERLRSFPVPPVFPTKKTPSPCQKEKLEQLRNSVYLSVPDPATFSSGQEMPFMLSLAFADEPCLAELLCESIAVHLYKRVGIAIRGDEYSERNILVSSATLRKNSGWAEGVIVLKGEIRTGDVGAEMSWSVPGYAHVKYILRVSLRPPSSFSSHIPTFIHEEEINVCTSSWGALDREFVSSGGTATPAVGLSGSLRRIY
ncbi:hypothetical protein D9611_004487 [Ephemerocybe angulata]|uniref:Uncharacterized protein n=1 Tax=Ephemerocybe angulata TaxID=980116 RepID=A0A8H5BJE7_9AGAR|nr:hypothetical protein D9611_004487 [Tulosesus angulatus]